MRMEGRLGFQGEFHGKETLIRRWKLLNVSHRESLLRKVGVYLTKSVSVFFYQEKRKRSDSEKKQ